MKKIYLFSLLILQILFLAQTVFSTTPEWVLYNKDSVPGYVDDNYLDLIRIDTSTNKKWIRGFSSGENNFLTYDNSNWTRIKTPDSLRSGSLTYVNDIIFNWNNSTWLSGTVNGLIKFGVSDTSYYLLDLPDTLWNQSYFTEMDTDDQNLWIASDSGLVKFDGTNFVRYCKLNSDIQSNKISQVKCDRNGDVWLGTWDSLIIKFSNNTWTSYSYTNTNLPPGNIYDIEIDKSGNKWFAITNYFIGQNTSGDQMFLAKYDDSTWTVWDSTNSLIPTYGFIVNIAIDTSDNIWFDSYNDIYKFDGLTHFDMYNYQNSGIPFDIKSINDMLFDKYQNLWIATSTGLLVYKDGGIVLSANEEQQNPAFMKTYPNPGEKIINYDYILNNNSNVKIILYSNSGKFIRKMFEGYEEAGNKTKSFRTDDIPAGTYYLVINIEGNTETKKMIIVK